MCELVGASALRVQFGSMVLWTCGAGVQMDTGLTCFPAYILEWILKLTLEVILEWNRGCCGYGIQMDTGLTSHARMDSGIDSRIDSGMEYVMLRLWTPDGYRIGIAFQLVFWN